MVPLVEKDQDRDVRVSLSFNTFIRGEIGEREELTLINL